MELEQQIKHFLENASEEEKHVLSQILRGFEKQKKYAYDYIAAFIGMEGGTFVEGKFIIEMPIAPLSNNRFGITHGGIIATLADSAMGYMLNQAYLQEGKFAVTTDLHIRYLSPGKGEKLIAKAFIVKKGKNTNITQCDVYNEHGTHVATVTANFFAIK